MNQLYILLGLATIGSLAGLIGGLLFFVKRDWAKHLCCWAVPFAAGVLISVSLLHLLPEARQEMGEGAFLVVLLAFVGAFIFEEFFAHLHHHEHKGRTALKTAIPLVIVGDTIHNFIDGVAIASAFLVEPSFGLVVALATFLHETPHEIGDFGVLLSAGWSKTRALLANFLSALAVFPGALLVYFFLGDAHDKIGGLLAISAGIFLYLGASDFLPEIKEESNKKKARKELMLFLLGVMIIYLLTFISPTH